MLLGMQSIDFERSMGDNVFKKLDSLFKDCDWILSNYSFSICLISNIQITQHTKLRQNATSHQYTYICIIIICPSSAMIVCLHHFLLGLQFRSNMYIKSDWTCSNIHGVLKFSHNFNLLNTTKVLTVWKSFANTKSHNCNKNSKQSETSYCKFLCRRLTLTHFNLNQEKKMCLNKLSLSK